MICTSLRSTGVFGASPTRKATEIDAKVSETGRYLSFLRDKNLIIMDAGTGRERALTTDGGGTLSWGDAEFIAQEELGRYTGYWWSPDDRYVAVARVDESPVAIVKRAAIGASGTELIEQRYPVAGTKNAIVDLYLMTPDGQRSESRSRHRSGSLSGPRRLGEGRAQPLRPAPQSRSEAARHAPRRSVRPADRALLFSETSPTWVNLTDNFKPLKDGSLIWSSERSGFSHLYRWKAGKWIQLTRGAGPSTGCRCR